MSFGIYSLYRKLQPRFRQQRFRLFIEQFNPSASTRILDVGGFPADWAGVPVPSQITIVNLFPRDPGWLVSERITYQTGDGCKLPFADQSFDIVFSNSAIEHLPRAEDQLRFASEALRVGKQIFVQTPNRWFPVEPHFVSLFLHYLPKQWQRPFVRWFTFRGLVRSGDNVELMQLFEELRLLSVRQMRLLFPGCHIHRERLCGLTKSLIALKKQSCQQMADRHVNRTQGLITA